MISGPGVAQRPAARGQSPVQVMIPHARSLCFPAAGYDPIQVTAAGTNNFQRLSALPGADLVKQGIDDLQHQRESEEALLVSIGAPRLRSLGIELPSTISEPEHSLYLRLARERGDGAHSAYNSLIRRLVSFERAASCAP